MANAISLSSTGSFIGNDGNWPTYQFAIGTPQHGVGLIPSTVLADTWAINSASCPSGISAAQCVGQRGGLFNPGDSSSWTELGGGQAYSLGIGSNYGWDQKYGVFGSDSLVIPTSRGSVPVPQAVIGSMTTQETATGFFGLASKQVTIGNSTAQNSTLQMLKTAGNIPSLSYSYSAGGSYNKTSTTQGTPGLLVLGGYDANSFYPNDVNFEFGSDMNNYLNVALQDISTTLGSNTTSLYSDHIQVLIDSTTAQIWLPKAACDAFEDAFGLNYSAIDQLYKISNTTRLRNLENKATVSFKLANSQASTDTVTITLPYAAFDASFYDNSRGTSDSAFLYFPIKRASSPTQYTLGRTFLQEAVLTVDHERRNFSVSQVKDLRNETPSLRNILSTSVSDNGGGVSAVPSPGPDGGSGGGGGGGISGGAIGGIVVAVVVIIAAIIGFLLFRRRRKNRQQYASPEAGAQNVVSPGPQPLTYTGNEKAGPSGAAEMATPVPDNSADYFGAYASAQRQHHKAALSNTSSELDAYDGRGRTRSPAPAYVPTIHETPPIGNSATAAGARTSASLPVELPAGMTAQELHSRHVSSNSLPAAGMLGSGLHSGASSPPLHSPISEVGPSPGDEDAPSSTDMGWNSPIEPDTPGSAQRVALSPIRGGAHLRDVRNGSFGTAGSGSRSANNNNDHGGMSATSGPMGLGLDMPVQREVSESLRREDSTRSRASRASDNTLVSAITGAGTLPPSSSGNVPGALQSGSSAIPRKPTRD